MVVAEQCWLETIFCWIKCDRPRTGRAIQIMYGLALDVGEVYWVVEGADNAVVGWFCRVSIALQTRRKRLRTFVVEFFWRDSGLGL
jgi:hypothetical protein